MTGTFFDRTDEFLDKLGRGKITGKLDVNQIYAHYQNAHPEFRHPDGGAAYFMERGLFGEYRTYMAMLADGAITEDGPKLHDAMADAMEHYSRFVHDNAPWEFGDLRDSGHPMVYDGSDLVYDRQPAVHRLSEAELREKDRLRRIYDPERYSERGAMQHAEHGHPSQHRGVIARTFLGEGER